jgi:uncharacterized protein YjbI with pentapeptide repeats
MANAISRDSRQKLVGGGKYSAEELNPSPASEIELFFWKRHKQAGSAASTALPKVEPWRAIDFSIDFSNLEFDEPLYLDRFFFPSLITFERASFSRSADFRNTAFAGPDYFKDADFSEPAHFERAALFDFTFYGATANFERATFSDSATFGGANFSGGANFEGATFSEHADFNGANFSGGANFDGTTFSEATFGGANFSGRANFDGAKFSGDANFERASFLSSEEIPSRWPLIAMTATFHHATFSERAYFNGATFSGAIFEEAIFFKEADFSYATFSTEADFASATFSGDVEFHATTFGRLTRFDFATIKSMMAFVNASMKGPTSFEWAEFRGEPPRFFGAQLHEGTVWRSVSWPIPRSRDEAGKYVDAYERLKLEMDRLKKHEDELDFFCPRTAISSGAWCWNSHRDLWATLRLRPQLFPSTRLVVRNDRCWSRFVPDAFRIVKIPTGDRSQSRQHIRCARFQEGFHRPQHHRISFAYSESRLGSPDNRWHRAAVLFWARGPKSFPDEVKLQAATAVWKGWASRSLDCIRRTSNVRKGSI